MAFSKITHHIEELNDNIQDLVTAKLEYYRLKMFKKATQTAARLVKLLVYGSIFLLFLGFLSVGFAILIGRALGDLSYGFFIIAGAYLVIFICYMTFGKNYMHYLLLKKFSSGLAKEDDEDEKEDKLMEIIEDEKNA